MSKSGVTALGALDESGLSSIAGLARTSVLTAGIAIAIGVSSTQSATLNPTQGLPDDVFLNPGYEDAWWGEWTGRSNVAAMEEALEGLGGQFTGLVLTDPLKLDGLSGGQHTIFTYTGEAREAFAIKSGGIWTAILFSGPMTNWTITGLEHEISQIVGFNGNTIIPIPISPTGILLLSALLGMVILGRVRSKWVSQSA